VAQSMRLGTSDRLMACSVGATSGR
jgi:hypothetical protein